MVDYYGNSIPVEPADEIDDVLGKFVSIHTGRRPIVVLLNDENHRLSIGLSENIGFLSYAGPQGYPNLTSLGDSSLGILDGVELFDCGEETEILRRHCIPKDKLGVVVKHFYLTGELSKEIQWEDPIQALFHQS